MSKRLDIFLQTTKTSMGRQGFEGYQLQALPADSRAFAKALSEGQAGHELAGADVDIYLAEDLLFFTKITLPLQTPDIKKAIALQLGILSPYGEDSLSAFAAQRFKDGYYVTLYFCRESATIPFLEILFKEGAHLMGLFPESQRYLTRDNQKLSWSLWSPGRFGKITHFNQGKVISRDLCSNQVSVSDIKERTSSSSIYTLDNAQAGQASAVTLLAQPAMAREYDMLPPSFRRPDYMKKGLMALAVINLILLLFLGCGKGIALYRHGAALDQQIEASRIDDEKAQQLKNRTNKLEKQLDNYRAIGANTDLTAFMAMLSKNLPDTAYIDQLRYDEATRTITLQGYTDDLPNLTANIADLGAATLKSTMKRRKRTYFHLEVSIP